MVPSIKERGNHVVTRVYACLVGNWVCLHDDPECVMGKNRVSPTLWHKEEAVIYSPFVRDKEHSYEELDHVQIFYKGKDYRINPIHIQLVNE